MAEDKDPFKDLPVFKDNIEEKDPFADLPSFGDESKKKLNSEPLSPLIAAPFAQELSQPASHYQDSGSMSQLPSGHIQQPSISQERNPEFVPVIAPATGVTTSPNLSETRNTQNIVEPLTPEQLSERDKRSPIEKKIENILAVPYDVIANYPENTIDAIKEGLNGLSEVDAVYQKEGELPAAAKAADAIVKTGLGILRVPFAPAFAAYDAAFAEADEILPSKFVEIAATPFQSQLSENSSQGWKSAASLADGIYQAIILHYGPKGGKVLAEKFKNNEPLTKEDSQKTLDAIQNLSEKDISKVANAVSDNAVKDVNKQQQELKKQNYVNAREINNNPEFLPQIKQQFSDAVIKGEMSPEEAQQHLSNIGAVAEVDKTISDHITDDNQRIEAIDLVTKINDLKSKIEGKDPNTTGPQQLQIDQAELDLRNIANEAAGLPKELSKEEIKSEKEKSTAKPEAEMKTDGEQLKNETNGINELLPNTLSPEEKQGSLRGGEANAAATAIAGRLSESIQGASEAGRKVPRRKIRLAQEKELTDYAKKNNLWIEGDFGEPDDGGAEQDVYINKDNKTVTKVFEGLLPEETWNDYFHRIAVHNSLFPEAAYTLKGFTEQGGRFAPVMEQPFIEMGDQKPTIEELESEMKDRGFDRVSDDKSSKDTKYTFENKNTGVIATDLHTKNVIKGKNGKLYFIDPMIEFRKDRKNNPEKYVDIAAEPEAVSKEGEKTITTDESKNEKIGEGNQIQETDGSKETSEILTGQTEGATNEAPPVIPPEEPPTNNENAGGEENRPVDKEALLNKIKELNDKNKKPFKESFVEFLKDNKASKLAEGIVRGLHPFWESTSRQTAVTIRKNLGKMNQKLAEVAEHSEDMRNLFAKQKPEDNIAFMLAIEDPKKYGLNEGLMKGIADSYRGRLDEVFKQVSEIKDLPYIEDYFPHFWKDPEGAKVFFSKAHAKRPIEGSKSFLKKRFHEDIMSGLEAGLELVSDNPEEITRLAEVNAWKFKMANNMFEDLKSQGLLKFSKTRAEAPEGWSLVNDPLFKRKSFIPKDEQKDYATMVDAGGGWYMPKDAANIVDNYLSRGLSGKPLYDIAKKFNNTLNQYQLGLSFFHGTTTSLEAIFTTQAIGLNELLRGNVKKGLKDLSSGIVFPIAIGDNLRIANKSIKDYKAGIINDRVQKLITANASIGLDKVYQTDALNNFKNAIARNEFGKAATKLPSAILDFVAKPIFEKYVPRLKVGNFIKLAESELAKLKDPTQEEIDKAIQKSWNSIDNRLGQMVYDNIFWDKVTKDLGFIGLRSLGWTGGSIREIGGAVGDITKSLSTVIKGEGISPRTAWLLSVVGGTAMYGAMTNYLLTGEPPKDAEDYFRPRTGGLNDDGTPARVSLPTYMKDIVSYSKHPIQTLSNKTAPLLNDIISIYKNEDFYKRNIYNPEDPAYKRGLDILEYEGSQLAPFAYRNKRGEEKSFLETIKSKWSTKEGLLQQIGIMPVPSENKEKKARFYELKSLLIKYIKQRNRPEAEKVAKIIQEEFQK